MSIRQELKKRSKEKAKRDLLLRINFWVFLCGLVLALFIFLARFDSLFLKDISLSGNGVVSEAELVKTVNETIDGYYFYIFPKKNYFLLPKKEIGQNILKNHLWINSTLISPKGVGQLEVFVTERKPEALWCSLDSTKEKCLFIDEKGLVFSEAPDFSDNIFTKLSNSELAGASLLGLQPVETEQFQKIDQIRRVVPEIFELSGFDSIRVERMFLENEQDVNVSVVANYQDRKVRWKVLFDTKDDLNKTASNLSAVFTSDEFKQELDENDWAIDYLDLRFGNKVFYTFLGDKDMSAEQAEIEIQN